MTRTSITVGPATDADRYRATDDLVWFQEVSSASTGTVLTGLDADQRFAAYADDADPATYPGIYGVFPLSLAVPGPSGSVRSVPCAGLTWVGVHPDHRRRGVLTAMLRHHFEQVHATPGQHISALHASEPAIYGRHGYGLASLEHHVTLGRGATLTAPGLDAEAASVSVRLAVGSDPDVPARALACHRAHADLGAVVGDLGYYERVCLDLPEQVRGREPLRVLFARRDGEDVGFAMFRRAEKWEQARPAGTIDVWMLVGAPATRLALLRRLVDFDLIGSVKVRNVGVDDELLHWAGGPRATAGTETYDNLWIRLVDLPEALTARAWSAPCDVVVEVSDRSAPWNDGRWRLHASASGEPSVEPSTADPDVRLPIEALGSAYLGGGNLLTLLRAGLVTETRPGRVRELSHALRTDTPPTGAVGF